MLLAALAATGAAVPAVGGGFTVDSTTDAVDADPGDGLCASAAGECALRAAIQETNALPGADTIQVPEGTFTLTIPGANEDAAATGDLDITDDLSLTGAGRDVVVVDAAALDRVIHVRSAEVFIDNMAIQHGQSLTFFPLDPTGRGGGLMIEAGAVLEVSRVRVQQNLASLGGGGIMNNGILTLAQSQVLENVGSLISEGSGGGGIVNSNGSFGTIEDSQITNNRSGSSGGGIQNGESATLMIQSSSISSNVTDVFGGGGIQNFGVLSVANSAITSNRAGATDPTADRGEGGGLINAGIVELINVTIAGNRGNALGGGIANGFASGSPQFGEASLSNVTLADNEAYVGSAIFNSALGVVRVVNSVVARSTAGQDCNGALDSLGHNLDSDGTCAFGHTGDIPATDPNLGQLSANGGTTLTIPLLFGSPAIDAGDPASCPAADQRGIGRPIDGDDDGVGVCDIGAYEAGASPPATPTPTAPSPAATPVRLPETGGPLSRSYPNALANLSGARSA